MSDIQAGFRKYQETKDIIVHAHQVTEEDEYQKICAPLIIERPLIMLTMSTMSAVECS